MSFPADLLGGNLRQSPLPKTNWIIALPPPESNRKAKCYQLRGFLKCGLFRPHISSSCCYQLSRFFPNNHARKTQLHSRQSAPYFTCEVKGNKQKANPPQIQRQSNTTNLTLSQFKASKVPLVPLVAFVPSANGKAWSPQSTAHQLPCWPPISINADTPSATLLTIPRH